MKLQSYMAVAVLAFSFSAVSSWATDADGSFDTTVTMPTQTSSMTSDQFSLDQSDLLGGGHGGGNGGGGNHGGGGDHGGGNHGGGGDHGGGGNHGGGGDHGGHPGHGVNPYPVHGGHYPWPHWPHPGFDRPVYGWDWDHLRVVTCTATNDAGDLFPVTEDGYFGIEYQNRLAEIEDAAIDRCYNETGGDESCRLLDCEAGY